MKYVILIHSNPDPWGHPTIDHTPEGRAMPAAWREESGRAFDALLAEISESGELVTAEALADPAVGHALPVGCGRSAGHRRPVRGVQGAPGRLLPARLRDPGAGRGRRGAVRGAGDVIELRPAMWAGADDQ